MTDGYIALHLTAAVEYRQRVVDVANVDAEVDICNVNVDRWQRASEVTQETVEELRIVNGIGDADGESEADKRLTAFVYVSSSSWSFILTMKRCLTKEILVWR